MKQYHKRFYIYGKTVSELIDKVNEFTKDVQITEVLEKEIEIQTNYDNDKEIDNSSPSDNKIKTTIYKYSYYAIVLILIEE
jgi:hypothetical protein